MMTFRRGVLAVLAAGLLLLSACGDGGSGDGDSNAAEDAQRDGEAEVNAAADRAVEDLAAAIAAIDPCKPDPAQVKNVMDPLVVLQGAGQEDRVSEAGALEALQRTVKAIARDYASGGQAGETGKSITDLARTVGLDPQANDWMTDLECPHTWKVSVLLEISGGAVPGPVVLSRITYSGSATLQGASSALSGSGPLATSVAVGDPVPGCSFNITTGGAELQVAGTFQEASQTFDLELTFGEFPMNTSMTCPGVTVGPTTAPMTGVFFPATVHLGETYLQELGGGVGGAGGTLRVDVFQTE